MKKLILTVALVVGLSNVAQSTEIKDFKKGMSLAEFHYASDWNTLGLQYKADGSGVKLFDGTTTTDYSKFPMYAYCSLTECFDTTVIKTEKETTVITAIFKYGELKAKKIKIETN